MIRLGLIASGSYLLHVAHATFWAQGRGMWHPESVALSFLAYGLAFGLLVAGVTARRPRRWLPLILVAFLLGTAGSCYVSSLTNRPGAAIPDPVLLSAYSAQLLLLGENPYVWDLSDAYSAFRASSYFSTPQLDGSSVSVLPYPALHFLLLVPIHALGLNGIRGLYVLCYALIGVLLFLRAPGPLRAVILLPLWVSPELLGFSLNFVTDAVWALLVLGCVLAWRRPTWRAILFGLACAYKQTPWLLAPFIVVRLLIDRRDPDRRPPLARSLYFLGLAGAVFLVVNAPFMLADLPAWIRAVFQPAADRLIYLGSGLASTTLFGLVELPKAFYAAASLTVMATLLLLYTAHFRRLRNALWLFPGLTLWFSYRSLQSYFVFWIPLLMAVLVVETRERLGVEIPRGPHEEPQEARGGPWQRLNRLPLRAARMVQARKHWTPGLLGVSLALILAAAGYTLAGNETLGVELLETRLGSSLSDADGMEILVHNTTDGTVTPRFAVQRASWQPYAWDIVEGPLSLPPGQSGRYRIRTDIPYRTLSLAEGGQLVVTEASGDYRVRGTLKFPPDESLGDPGAVLNASYLLRAGQAGIPSGWTLQQGTSETPIVEHTQAANGLRAMRLGLQAHAGRATWEAVGMAQGVLFPDGEITTWVKPPDPGGDDAASVSVAYGLEFHDGQRRLWVLFGPSGPREGYLGRDHYFIERRLAAGTWSEQTIDLNAIYSRLSWPLPPLTRTVRGGVELLTRGTSLTLFVAARNRPRPELLSGEFGPVRILPGVEAVRQRIRQRVERQEEYSLALQDLERRRRNFDRARELQENAVQPPPE